MTVELVPLGGLPEVRPGDDLAAMLEGALATVGVREDDVVAVTQKVVSKAEGRIVEGDDRAAWVERESVGLVARRGDLTIARTRHGFVCANAGVDASNVAPGFLTLLPEDPDASAEHLQKELAARFGLSRFGVVITDTFGRPWREGVVDVAIGCAGLPALVDLRGGTDDHGRVLESTVVAVADAVAAASGLVMTKTARVPAALVRGLDALIGEAPPGPARGLVRSPEDDLFLESALVAMSSTRSSPSFASGPVPRDAVEDAVAAACAVPLPHGWVFVAIESPRAERRLLVAAARERDPSMDQAGVLIVPCVPRRALDDDHDGTLLSAGAAIRTLTVALHTRRLGARWQTADPAAARRALLLDEDLVPLGFVAVGRTREAGARRPQPPIAPGDVLDWRD